MKEKENHGKSGEDKGRKGDSVIKRRGPRKRTQKKRGHRAITVPEEKKIAKDSS